MEPREELELVRKAITSGLSNCCEWVNDRVARRVRADPGNQGLTPEAIKRYLCDFVKAGGLVEQRAEERTEWRDRRQFWYRAVLPLEGFPRGLFVEIILLDDDPDCPCVALVNAHPQRS